MAGRCLRALRSTTRITTRLTVILTTWIAYRKAITAAGLRISIQKRSEQLWQRLGLPRRSGTARTLVANGIGNMLSHLWRPLARFAAACPPDFPVFASGVGLGSSLVNAVHASAGNHAEGLTPNTSVVSGGPFTPITQRTTPSAAHPSAEPVYNLAVDEAECYYANGILVHNCSMGLLCLREDGYLALTQEYVASQMAARMHRGKRQSVRNAYGV